MALELVYTSSPRGLRPGTSGYCTVACTRGMPANYIELLESLSGYKAVFPAGHPQAHLNPVSFSHLRMVVGGKGLSIVSRVGFCGADYTGRTNKIAHHAIVEAGEQSPAGPAWLLAQPEALRADWRGEPSVYERPMGLPMGDEAPDIARKWQEITGDAGWAGHLAAMVDAPTTTPLLLIFEPGMDVLALVREVVAILPSSLRWQATFSTYVNTLPPNATCLWRFHMGDAPALADARRNRSAQILDLRDGRRLGSVADTSPYIEAARTGRAVEPRRAASRAVALGPLPGALAAAPFGAGTGRTQEPSAAESPLTLRPLPPADAPPVAPLAPTGPAAWAGGANRLPRDPRKIEVLVLRAVVVASVVAVLALAHLLAEAKREVREARDVSARAAEPTAPEAPNSNAATPLDTPAGPPAVSLPQVGPPDGAQEDQQATAKPPAGAAYRGAHETAGRDAEEAHSTPPGRTSESPVLDTTSQPHDRQEGEGTRPAQSPADVQPPQSCGVFLLFLRSQLDELRGRETEKARENISLPCLLVGQPRISVTLIEDPDLRQTISPPSGPVHIQMKIAGQGDTQPSDAMKITLAPQNMEFERSRKLGAENWNRLLNGIVEIVLEDASTRIRCLTRPGQSSNEMEASLQQPQRTIRLWEGLFQPAGNLSAKVSTQPKWHQVDRPEVSGDGQLTFNLLPRHDFSLGEVRQDFDSVSEQISTAERAFREKGSSADRVASNKELLRQIGVSLDKLGRRLTTPASPNPMFSGHRARIDKYVKGIDEYNRDSEDNAKKGANDKTKATPEDLEQRAKTKCGNIANGLADILREVKTSAESAFSPDTCSIEVSHGAILVWKVGITIPSQ
ncbi:MAG: hypothetical protein HZA54_05870 [Planctomycetes bacterium]|nr:hypothetical protein [Planctomycetota bacterium]